MKKHCEGCNCEQSWTEIKGLGVEISSPIKINSIEDINIPKGQRLPTYAEYAMMIEQKILPFDEKWIEYCTSPLFEGTRAVWLDVSADWFYLICVSLPFSDYGRARRYRLVRKVKV